MIRQVNMLTMTFFLAFALFVAPLATPVTERVQKILTFTTSKKTAEDADALQKKKVEEEEAAKAREAAKAKEAAEQKEREKALGVKVGDLAREKTEELLGKRAGTFAERIGTAVGQRASGAAYRAETAKATVTSQKEKDAVKKMQDNANVATEKYQSLSKGIESKLTDSKIAEYKADYAKSDPNTRKLLDESPQGKAIKAKEDLAGAMKALDQAKNDLTKAQLKVGGGVALGLGGIAAIGGIAGAIAGTMASGPDTGAVAGATGSTTTAVPTSGTTTVSVIGDYETSDDSGVYEAAIEEADQGSDKESSLEDVETDEEIIESDEEPESVFTVEGSESEEDAAFTVEGGEAIEE